MRIPYSSSGSPTPIPPPPQMPAPCPSPASSVYHTPRFTPTRIWVSILAVLLGQLYKQLLPPVMVLLWVLWFFWYSLNQPSPNICQAGSNHSAIVIAVGHEASLVLFALCCFLSYYVWLYLRQHYHHFPDYTPILCVFLYSLFILKSTSWPHSLPCLLPLCHDRQEDKTGDRTGQNKPFFRPAEERPKQNKIKTNK